MSKSNNVQAQANRESDQSNGLSRSGYLGELQLNSTVLRSKQIGTDPADCVGRNSDWEHSIIRDTTAGKILERLESLEAQTLSYIHSHQAQLEARLGKSKQFEDEFLRESNQIKSDIYHLAVAQQENEIGDGD